MITSHPIRFGSGEWTCVVGEFEGGGRMVTVARWRDGAIAEEYIWMQRLSQPGFTQTTDRDYLQSRMAGAT